MSFNLRVLVVDDSTSNCDHLENLLNLYCNNIQSIVKATSVLSALKVLQSQPIDLIFLDVEMPGEQGMSLLEYTSDKMNYECVFVSAYPKYAVNAFEYGALHYILKPISVKKLIAAVDMAYEKITATKKPKVSIQEFEIGTINIVSKNQVDVVRIDDIIRFEADGRYSTCYLKDKRRICSTVNLGKYESRLSEDGFVRIHKSHLVNFKHVIRFFKADSGAVELINGDIIAISQRKKEMISSLILDRS